MEVEYHYAALVESSDDAIIAKDLESRIIIWNPAAERIFGFSAEEMLGQSIRRLIPEGREQEESDILALIRAGERVAQFYTERLHKAGHTIPVALAVSPVRDRLGNIIGASKNIRDASQRIAMIDRWRNSERRFRMLADNITQFAWILGGDGRVTWYNRRWYEYTGMNFETMSEHGLMSELHPEHAERVSTKFRRCLETGEPWEDLFPLRGADGTYRWFLSHAVPVADETGKITEWFGTNTDITEQRQQAEHIGLLLNEVNHRSKNMLMKIRAIARRTQGVTPEFLESFDRRLSSLSVNQDILVRQNWRDVPLSELVALQLRFLGEGQRQIDIAGPDAALNPRAAEAVGMALYELATNSLKYGALSTVEGNVAIHWEADPESNRFAMRWTEQGGPETVVPQNTGFGTTLILDVPRQSLDAQVALDYHSTGVTWSLESHDALARPETGGQGPLKDLPRA